MINDKSSSTSVNSKKSEVRGAAVELLNEGKKFGNELYEEGTKKIHQVEDQIINYSEDMLKKVQENPLRSVLIAGGIGFLLSLLTRK